MDDDPRERGEARRSSGAFLTTVLVVLAAAGAFFGYQWLHREPPAQPELATAASAPDAGVDAGQPVALPTGDGSAQLRQAAGELSKRPEWERWLAEPHVISRLVAGAYRVADGDTVPPLLLFFATDQSFTVEPRNGKLFLGHETLASRTTITDVVTAIDPGRAAAAYARLGPYFEAAFREIARPNEHLNAVLHQAIHELLATPVPAQEPALVKNGAAYFFEDQQLEKLPPAQKQLLRMGNANALKIQQWLAALDRALPP